MKSTQSVLETKCIHVDTDLNELSKVLEWFQDLTQESVNAEDWMQCQIALAEGFTNAVRHAHHSLPAQTLVEIDLHFYPNHVEMRIWDCGPPFSLMEQIERYKASVTDESISGRGLLLLQKIASELDYRRVDDTRNCLSLIKRRSPRSNSIPN
ncbi:ATP-binding protein [Altericista sp. CCNU0014]|uniref:ATP-binding protein n=1 Tax=Altericista sp. CCNU0014 TaxID=3082949 RepID=UPI00384D6E10